MLFLILFLAIPAAEIFLFIEVGGRIGAWATVGLIFSTAIIGFMILRIQGIRIIQRAREQIANNKKPVAELAHGAALAFAAILLLTPGFISDSIGALLLVPPLRHFLIKFVLIRIAAKYERKRRGNSIDGEYKVISEDDDNSNT
tara:strand:- start:107568 stop:107999 length:432 start_codon:yes stop_codon:yes gene_type:complete